MYVLKSLLQGSVELGTVQTYLAMLLFCIEKTLRPRLAEAVISDFIDYKGLSA